MISPATRRFFHFVGPVLWPVVGWCLRLRTLLRRLRPGR